MMTSETYRRKHSERPLKRIQVGEEEVILISSDSSSESGTECAVQEHKHMFVTFFRIHLPGDRLVFYPQVNHYMNDCEDVFHQKIPTCTNLRDIFPDPRFLGQQFQMFANGQEGMYNKEVWDQCTITNYCCEDFSTWW